MWLMCHTPAMVIKTDNTAYPAFSWGVAINTRFVTQGQYLESWTILRIVDNTKDPGQYLGFWTILRILDNT